MTLKQWLLISVLNLCIVVPALLGMDNKQLPHFTKEEDAFNAMATHCPEAISIIARDILAQHPGITWQEFLDLYTARQNGQPPFVNATSAMIHAIWNEICTVRLKTLEPLQRAMFEKKCIFRSIPGLARTIESLKNQNQNVHAARALIIIDPALDAYAPSYKEALTRSQVYSTFISSQIGLPIRSHVLLPPSDHDHRGPQQAPHAHYLSDSRPERYQCIYDGYLSGERKKGDLGYETGLEMYFKAIDTLISNEHFVLITTFDPLLINHLNKDRIIVLNLPDQPTPKEIFIALKEIEIKNNCPNKIIQNLDAISQMVRRRMEEERVRGGMVFLTFAILECLFNKWKI